MSKINTSTTKGKIEVMRALVRGCKIQELYCAGRDAKWQNIRYDDDRAVWDWDDYNYRVKPKTVEEFIECELGASNWMTNDLNEVFASGVRAGIEFQKEKNK